MPNMSRRGTADCSCPFNEATGKEGEEAKIGLAYGQDPPTCLRRCRETYLGKLSGKPDISPEACDILLTTTNRQQFHPLYWCDSSLCGVWIDPNGGLEQDRMLIISCQHQGNLTRDTANVGLIINTCQKFVPLLSPQAISLIGV